MAVQAWENNVADPLSMKPAVLAAMLLNAGSDELRACRAVKEKDSLQTVTSRWDRYSGNLKVSEPVPQDQKVIASIAALMRSRAPAAVSADSEESPTQGTAPASLHDAPVAKAAEAPIDLTAFQRQCVAGYAEDPYFRDEQNLVGKTLNQGLRWVGDRLVIPDFSDLREKVIQGMHEAPYKGHTGVNKTSKAVERLYWWLTVRQDVQAFVKTCQIMKSTNQKPAGLLQPLPVPHRRWGSVSVDLITALPETKKGNTAIVVFCDRLSKMVHIASCRIQINAVEFVELFKHEVFRLHGLPYELVSDRDTRFTSHYMREVCRLMSVKQSMSTAYHPQSDGQTERSNRTLEEMLRHYVVPVHDDWDTLLDYVECAINDSWQESTQETPFMLNYGQHPLNALSLDTHSDVPAAIAHTVKWQDAVERAKECLHRAQQRQKAYADQKRRDITYKVGDDLLLNTKNFVRAAP